MIKLKKIQDAKVENKTVLLRADLDVPIEKSKIKNQKSKVADSSRLEAWFPTLEYLLKQNAKVIIAGHLGRPAKQFSIFNSQFSISEPEFSLEPVVQWLSDKVNSKYTIKPMYHKLVYDTVPIEGFRILSNLFVLQNLRFFKEEEENDEDFSKKLASLADVYVNDAFASSHRAHASIVGITKFLPSYAGLRLQEEVKTLSEVLENPKRPLCVIIGGAKIETKLPLVEKMHAFADYVLVGGEIAENDKVLLKVQHEKIQGQKAVLLVADLTSDLKDITEKSAENFLQIAQKSQTIVWNGPMGYINEKLKIKNEKLKAGDEGHTSFLLAYGIINSGAYTIVGGGDTVGFLKENNLLDKFTFVSTGGGAMLEFLAGIKLPGLEALKQ